MATQFQLSDTTPAAPSGKINIKWQQDSSANISAYYDPGSGGGAVSSVFGRTGAVVATSGDYTAAQVGAPPTTRTITAGTGLTGGGDLSADRTLSVVDDTTNQRVKVLFGTTVVGTRPSISFIQGSGISLSLEDDPPNNKTTVQISANIAAVQTPWVSDHDAANFKLKNANAIGIGVSTINGLFESSGNVSAGRVNAVTVSNAAGANTANKVRIRLGPTAGFVGTDLQPYIESYCENAGSQAAGLALGTYNGGSLAEQMRISATGNVGVSGATNPLAQLQIGQRLSASNVSFDANYSYNLYYDGSSWRYIQGTDPGFQLYFSSAGSSGSAFKINSAPYGGTAGAVATIANLVTVLVGGNVGIGTASPSALLDVKGFIRVTDLAGAPTTGSGLEIVYNPGATPASGYIQSYTRGAGTFGALEINAAPLKLAMNGGNVGIGTASPNAALHVAGPMINGVTTNTLFNAALMGNSQMQFYSIEGSNQLICVYKYSTGTTKAFTMNLT